MWALEALESLQSRYQSRGTYKERDRVTDELRVLLHNFLDALLLNIFRLILFKVENDFGATSKGLTYNCKA